jgi:hypothetical protein
MRPPLLLALLLLVAVVDRHHVATHTYGNTVRYTTFVHHSGCMHARVSEMIMSHSRVFVAAVSVILFSHEAIAVIVVHTPIERGLSVF